MPLKKYAAMLLTYRRTFLERKAGEIMEKLAKAKERIGAVGISAAREMDDIF